MIMFVTAECFSIDRATHARRHRGGAAIMLCSSRKRKNRRPLTVSAGFAKNRSSLKNRSFAAKIIPGRTQAGLPLLGGGCAAETLIAHHTETISGRSRSPDHPPRRSRNTRRAGVFVVTCLRLPLGHARSPRHPRLLYLLVSAPEALRLEPFVDEPPALVVAEVRVEVVADACERLYRHARRAGEVGRLALGQ